MGWDQVTFHIFAQVSRHNSDQDKTDDYLWDEFKDRVRNIAAEHRYESLDIDCP